MCGELRHPGGPGGALDDEHQGQECGRGHAVQPEMIGGHGHGQGRQRRICQRQPAPPAAGRGHDHHRDQQCPAHMHRRHGRQLIGVDPGIWPVDRLPVVERGVDHAVTGQEAGRRDRDQLDEQGAGGKQHNRGAHLPVPAPMADEQPDQAADQHGEVQHRVIEVERLDHQRVRQEHPLDRRFARQGDRPLEMPDPLCPAHRPSGEASERLPANCHSAYSPSSRPASKAILAARSHRGPAARRPVTAASAASTSAHNEAIAASRHVTWKLSMAIRPARLLPACATLRHATRSRGRTGRGGNGYRPALAPLRHRAPPASG